MVPHRSTTGCYWALTRVILPGGTDPASSSSFSLSGACVMRGAIGVVQESSEFGTFIILVPSIDRRPVSTRSCWQQAAGWLPPQAASPASPRPRQRVAERGGVSGPALAPPNGDSAANTHTISSIDADPSIGLDWTEIEWPQKGLQGVVAPHACMRHPWRPIQISSRLACRRSSLSKILPADRIGAGTREHGSGRTTARPSTRSKPSTCLDLGRDTRPPLAFGGFGN